MTVEAGRKASRRSRDR